MKGQAEHPFVPALARIVAFVDRDRGRHGACRRVHSNHAAARAFGYPELIVRTPYDFPRHAQPGGHDAERKRRLRGNGLQNDLRDGDDGELMLVLVLNLHSLLVGLLLRVQLVVVLVGCRGAGLTR